MTHNTQRFLKMPQSYKSVNNNKSYPITLNFNAQFTRKCYKNKCVCQSCACTFKSIAGKCKISSVAK